MSEIIEDIINIDKNIELASLKVYNNILSGQDKQENERINESLEENKVKTVDYKEFLKHMEKQSGNKKKRA